jgi:hypothetical protein
VDLTVLNLAETLVLAATRGADEETGAAAVRLIKNAVRRWQESPGSSREPSSINEQEAAAFKCAPPTRRGGAGDSESARLLDTLARGKLESAPTGASFNVTDATPTLADGDCTGLTAADQRAGAARATMVRRGETFTLLYDDAAYKLAALPLAAVLAGVGTRFVVKGAAEALRDAALDSAKMARRCHKRVENQVREALESDLRREAEARVLGEQRVLAASMNISEAQLEVLRAALVTPRTVEIGDHLVALVPASRALVVRKVVFEVIRRPLEESGQQLRAASTAGRRKRAKRGCPNTSLGGDATLIMAELYAQEQAEAAELAEKASKRAKKATARGDKKAIDLCAALGDLIEKGYDIAALTLPKVKALLEWRGVAVPVPWSNTTKPTGIAAWAAGAFNEGVLLAQHKAMLPVLAQEDDDELMSEGEQDMSDDDGDVYTTLN